MNKYLSFSRTVCFSHPAPLVYQLQVAHLPDKANNYLTPALSVLEKNT